MHNVNEYIVQKLHDIWKSDYICNKNDAHKDHIKTFRQRNELKIKN